MAFPTTKESLHYSLDDETVLYLNLQSTWSVGVNFRVVWDCTIPWFLRSRTWCRPIQAKYNSAHAVDWKGRLRSYYPTIFRVILTTLLNMEKGVLIYAPNKNQQRSE